MHGFVLPESWLLSTTLQLQLWKAANAEPSTVEAVLMESLRLFSQKSRASGTMIKLVPGRAVAPLNVEVDSIHGAMEVFTRASAWFMTMAFVVIRKPTWFDLQTAIFASDKVLELVQQTSGGHSPPLTHFL